MDNIYKETKTLIKNQILDFLNDEIDTTKQQLKDSIESCDKNYFSGSLDSLIEVKEYIKNM